MNLKSWFLILSKFSFFLFVDISYYISRLGLELYLENKRNSDKISLKYYMKAEKIAKKIKSKEMIKEI